jgi:hypothetical protein
MFLRLASLFVCLSCGLGQDRQASQVLAIPLLSSNVPYVFSEEIHLIQGGVRSQWPPAAFEYLSSLILRCRESSVHQLFCNRGAEICSLQ